MYLTYLPPNQKELSILLRTPIDAADEIKKNYGSLLPRDDEKITKIKLSLDAVPFRDKSILIGALTEGFLMSSYKFTTFKEKPKKDAPSSLANVGLFILNGDIFFDAVSDIGYDIILTPPEYLLRKKSKSAY